MRASLKAPEKLNNFKKPI